MKTNNGIHGKFANAEVLRWGLIALGAGIAFLLAATLETGRAHAAGGAFIFQGAINRLITPNGDAKNDVAILCFDNPKDSGVSGKIFDLRGGHVADMTLVANITGSPVPSAAANAADVCKAIFPGQFKPQAVTWDARVGGAAVASGVYVYRIEAEQGATTGTLLVVR